MPGLRTMKPAILERLRGVQRSGDGWLAFCPAHNDQHKRSLSVGVGADGRTLLKCHAAGCPVEQITAAVSMTLADLAPPLPAGGRPSRREVVAYDYRNERGELLSQNVRFEPKDFLQRRPDGRGRWRPGTSVCSGGDNARMKWTRSSGFFETCGANCRSAPGAGPW